MTDHRRPGENPNIQGRHLWEPFLHFTYTVDM
jgi:hypothetical protein